MIEVDKTAFPFDFDLLFGRLSVPVLLVENSSKVLAVNAAAAGLFSMSVEEIEGQLWAGLDGRMNQIMWKQKMRTLDGHGMLTYDTDLITSSDYLRPVGVEAVRVGDNWLILTLENYLARTIDENDLEALDDYSKTGFWTYNIVDQELYLSPYLRRLAGVEEQVNPKAFIEHLRAKIHPDDWKRGKKQLGNFLKEPSSFTQSLQFEGPVRTERISVSCTSTGNDLQITRLFGLVASDEIVSAKPGEVATLSKEFAAFSIEYSGEIILWGNPAGEIIYANQAAVDYLGYPLNELIGMSSEAFSPDVTPKLLAEAWESLRVNKLFEATYRVTNKNGEEGLLFARNTYLRFGGKEYSCAICHDVTAEHSSGGGRAGEATPEQQLVSFSIEHARDLIFWTRPNGEMAYVNATVCQKLGYTKEELVGSHAQVIVKTFSDDLRESWWAALREQSYDEAQWTLTAKDGKEVIIEASVSYLNIDGEEYSCGICRDITDERDRRKRFELARMSIENSPEMVIWSQPDGNIAYTNRAVSFKLGYTEEELQRLSSHSLVPDYDDGSWVELWNHIREQRHIDLQTEFLAKDGRILQVQASLSYVRFGEEEFICGINRDVTEENYLNRQASISKFSIDEAPDLIFWTRPDGSISYVNKAVTRHLGYSLEELYDLDVSEIAPEFTEEPRIEFWNQLRYEGDIYINSTLATSMGETFDISGRVYYLKFDQDEYACTICRDVTEENVRKKRRKLFESTVDNSEDMILWASPDSVIQFANENFCKRVGLPREEIVGAPGNTFFQSLTEEYRHRVWERLRAGEVMETEQLLSVSATEQIPVSTRMSHLEFEGDEYSCIYLRDLTETRRRELQLQLAREALDTTSDHIVWLDVNLNVQYINGTLRDVLRETGDSIVGEFYTRIFASVKPDNIKGEDAFVYEMKTDTGRRVKLNFKCDRIDYGDQVIYMLTGRDVTEQEERHQDLEKANAEISGLRDKLKEENVTLKEENAIRYNINNIITVSSKYQKVLAQVGRVADVDTTVLITGETGTGKELLARAIHQLSDRADYPLVKVNCAALPENLIESELFGHEKGAFTGAVGRKKGRFEMADKGTFFLDEVGELPLMLQSKLLRVLQEDEFERLGGTETIKVDVRLVAATNRDLEAMVAAGTFRADLYYRLNVFPIENMALRDRPEDIPVLIRHFVTRFAKRQNKEIKEINGNDMARMQRYAFPGNIRELENLVERAVVLCQSDVLTIPFEAKKVVAEAGPTELLSMEEMQRKHIIDALQLTEGRVTGPHGAGVLLDMNDRTLVSRMRKLGIRKIDYLR